jgi:hypothetical protein
MMHVPRQENPGGFVARERSVPLETPPHGVGNGLESNGHSYKSANDPLGTRKLASLC